MAPMSDGIEIHYDEKNGYLELACEPDAFARYREIARDQLKDVPEIPLENVFEMNIVDTATFVARRDTRKYRVGSVIVGLIITVVLGLAVVGTFAILARIIS